MARFEIDAKMADELLAGVDGLSKDVQGRALDATLEKAGEKLSEYFQGAIARKAHPHIRRSKSKFRDDMMWADDFIDAGDFVDSIKSTAVKKDKRGKYVDVGPRRTSRGKGKKPITNANLGVILEYGSRTRPASHWMSNTVDDVGGEILDEMENGINEIINKNIGG